jgi:hypothetical protein
MRHQRLLPRWGVGSGERLNVAAGIGSAQACGFGLLVLAPFSAPD